MATLVKYVCIGGMEALRRPPAGMRRLNECASSGLRREPPIIRPTTLSRACVPFVLSGTIALDVEGPSRRRLLNRLIRRLNYARRAALRPASMDTLARLSDVTSQPNMLFVVGVARSGTSAMLDALGLNDDVFLFFEANFFRENLKPGFRERYNARHIATGAPYRCPSVALPNSSWVEILNGLKQQYRFVGEKIAFGPHEPDRWTTEFLAFHKRHFPGAAYVLMFRNPRDTIFSPRTKWGVENLLPWTRSYVAGQRALIRLRLNFPRTVPVFLETAGSATFQTIEQCLGHAMPHLADAFRAKSQSMQDSDLVPGELHRVVAELEALYPTLCEGISNSGYGRSDSSLLRIDASLAELYQGLDLLHYSPGARLERLRRKLLGKHLWF